MLSKASGFFSRQPTHHEFNSQQTLPRVTWDTAQVRAAPFPLVTTRRGSQTTLWGSLSRGWQLLSPRELLLRQGSATRPCLSYSSRAVEAMPAPGHGPCWSRPLSRSRTHRLTSRLGLSPATSLQTCLVITGLQLIPVNVSRPDPIFLTSSLTSDLPQSMLAALLVPALPIFLECCGTGPWHCQRCYPSRPQHPVPKGATGPHCALTVNHPAIGHLGPVTPCWATSMVQSKTLLSIENLKVSVCYTWQDSGWELRFLTACVPGHFEIMLFEAEEEISSLWYQYQMTKLSPTTKRVVLELCSRQNTRSLIPSTSKESLKKATFAGRLAACNLKGKKKGGEKKPNNLWQQQVIWYLAPWQLTCLFSWHLEFSASHWTLTSHQKASKLLFLQKSMGRWLCTHRQTHTKKTNLNELIKCSEFFGPS